MQRILRAIHWTLNGPGTVMKALYTFSPSVLNSLLRVFFITVFSLLWMKKLRPAG